MSSGRASVRRQLTCFVHALLDLLKGRGHKDIGPEVRRELLEGRPRGTAAESGQGMGGDDTMVDV